MPTQLEISKKHIFQLLEQNKAQVAIALPKHLTADRLCRIAFTEMTKNPSLFDCTPQSIMASVITAAQLGLEVGVLGQAYLVPYGKTCQLIPGWQGYVELMNRAGRATVWTGAVREGDEFSFRIGADPKLDHVPGDDDMGVFTHVYAVGWVTGAARPVIEVWSRAKVKKHLDAYNKVGGKHYAFQNENNFEMYGRKVALLQVIKYMPKSVEIGRATELSYRGEEGVQNMTFTPTGIQDADFDDIPPGSGDGPAPESSAGKASKAASAAAAKTAPQPLGASGGEPKPLTPAEEPAASVAVPSSAGSEPNKATGSLW